MPIFLYVFLTGSFTLGAYFYQKNKKIKLIDRIENIKNISDVVCLLQYLSDDATTEEIADKIIDAFTEEEISEDCMIKLSKLHKKYAIDNGIQGYSINMLWSCLVQHTGFSSFDEKKHITNIEADDEKKQ
mgnify:CR=1 FL=1